MARISFQKRQKEMKRQEKQKMKAEKRAQKKLTKNDPQILEPELEVLTGPSDLTDFASTPTEGQ